MIKQTRMCVIKLEGEINLGSIWFQVLDVIRKLRKLSLSIYASNSVTCMLRLQLHGLRKLKCMQCLYCEMKLMSFGCLYWRATSRISSPVSTLQRYHGRPRSELGYRIGLIVGFACTNSPCQHGRFVNTIRHSLRQASRSNMCAQLTFRGT